MSKYDKFEKSMNKDFEELLELSKNSSWKNFGRKITFYAPSFIDYKSSNLVSRPNTFPSISITGNFCALNCKHCNGRILQTMISVSNNEELFNVCKDLKAKGCVGCLISGGCLGDASVPIDRFSTAISKIKKDLGLIVVVHTGIVNEETARKLKMAGVDAALMDIIGSNETIHEICQIEKTVEDYEESMKVLKESKIPFVPHIVVGLHYGRLKGEFKAIEMISKYDPASVVVIAFMPMIGTQMEKIEPPVPEDIAKVLISIRLALPKTPVVLGCVRPLGEHRIKTDELAIKSGVNGIAFPSEKAIILAKEMNLEISSQPICCSQIYMNG